MRVSRWLVLAASVAMGTGRVAAQETGGSDSLGARIWLDRGDQAVLDRGDRVRIYYQTSADAYVAIFHIDTDGAVQLLYPRAPDIDHFVQGQKDYQLLFPRSAYWYVDEYPGTGYFFIVASPEPFDFSDFGYSPYERGWDLTRVGRTVYRDPYVAMDDYVSHLIPDWRTTDYALDFLTYYVGRVEPYPRFLCYDCHEFRSYTDWDPYSYACSTFRLVIWNDPYFSPEARYDGTRVVFARPEFGRPRYQFKERLPGEPWSPLVRRREAPPRHEVQFLEPSVAPRPTIASPPRRAVRASPSSREDVTPRRVIPGDAGTRAGSPSSIGRVLPPTGGGVPDARRPAGGRTGEIVPGRRDAGDRPVLQRRAPVPAVRARPSDAARRSGGSGGVTILRPQEGGAARREVSPARGRPVERSAPTGGRQTIVRPRESRPEVRPAEGRRAVPTTRERPAVRARPRGGGGSPVRRSSGGGRRRGGGQ